MIKTFTQTSDKPYVRHDYKIVDFNGNFIIVDNWEDVQKIWWNTPTNTLSHIEALDKKVKHKAKGFA